MSALSRRGKGYKSLPEDPTHLEETRVVLPRDISDLGPPEPTGATPHLPFAPNGPGAAAGSSGSKCAVCPKGFRGYVFFLFSSSLNIFCYQQEYAHYVPCLRSDLPQEVCQDAKRGATQLCLPKLWRR